MSKELLHKSPNIFIADDDEDDVYFVRMALKELDPEIKLKHFLNGRLLLDELDKKDPSPDLVLLDLNMPILDGRETLKKIRQSYGNDLPIVILSTSNHAHEKELCYEYGASSYYTKPCNFPLYREIIKNLKAKWLDHSWAS